MFQRTKNLDEKRFFWRTRNPYIKRIEKILLKKVLGDYQGNKIIEVGSGEGANLFHLKKYFSDLTGIDISEEKLTIAAKYVPEAKFLQAQAGGLPFWDSTFDLVFCRDVLHHLRDSDEKAKVIKEMKRICKENGKIIIIEPNILNPIIFFQAALQKDERGIKKSRVKRLKRLLTKNNLEKIKVEFLEPLPLDRLILHYQFGLPKLALVPILRLFLRFENFIFKILIPRGLWSYFIFRIENHK